MCEFARYINLFWIVDSKLFLSNYKNKYKSELVIRWGKWIKSVIPINLIVLLLLVHMVYIGIRCYVKDWREERGYRPKKEEKW